MGVRCVETGEKEFGIWGPIYIKHGICCRVTVAMAKNDRTFRGRHSTRAHDRDSFSGTRRGRGMRRDSIESSSIASRSSSEWWSSQRKDESHLQAIEIGINIWFITYITFIEYLLLNMEKKIYCQSYQYCISLLSLIYAVHSFMIHAIKVYIMN